MDPHRATRVRQAEGIEGHWDSGGVAVDVASKTIAAVYDFCCRLGCLSLVLCVCRGANNADRRKPEIIAAHAADKAQPRPAAAV